MLEEDKGMRASVNLGSMVEGKVKAVKTIEG